MAGTTVGSVPQIESLIAELFGMPEAEQARKFAATVPMLYGLAGAGHRHTGW